MSLKLRFKRVAVSILVLGFMFSPKPLARAQWVVVDPANLGQNILTALQTLCGLFLPPTSINL